MDFDPPLWELAVRMGAAGALAAVIGWEREVRRKPAGLKTHTLVAIGACCFTMLTLRMTGAMILLTDRARPDPTRIIEGIVGGLGFLGAGAIIQGRGNVEGLTTAAGIWVVGAIGVAIGLGDYRLGILTTACILVVLLILRWHPRSGD